MRRVIVESPYAGNVELHLGYLRAALRDCLLRGESPYASHALLTQDGVLDDADFEERDRGIRAGFAWREASEATVFYTDLGWSRGMYLGLRDAERIGHPVEYRTMPGWLVLA